MGREVKLQSQILGRILHYIEVLSYTSRYIWFGIPKFQQLSSTYETSVTHKIGIPNSKFAKISLTASLLTKMTTKWRAVSRTGMRRTPRKNKNRIIYWLRRIILSQSLFNNNYLEALSATFDVVIVSNCQPNLQFFRNWLSYHHTFVSCSLSMRHL